MDVIGCGINFHTNTAFFTKNGRYLGMQIMEVPRLVLIIVGTAFKDLKPNMHYYPSIAMKKPNEMLRANFGQEPFAFDIDTMMQKEKDRIQQEIMTSRVQPRETGSVDETQFIRSLIG